MTRLPTYAHALEVLATMGMPSDRERMIGWVQSVAPVKDEDRMTKPAMELGIQVLSSCLESVNADDSIVIWVEANVERAILDSADSVPEPTSLSEVKLPRRGVVFFQDLWADRSENPDFHLPETTRALSWDLVHMVGDQSGNDLQVLMVWPWYDTHSIEMTMEDVEYWKNKLGPVMPEGPSVWAPDLEQPTGITADTLGQNVEVVGGVPWSHASMWPIKVLTALAGWCEQTVDLVEQEVTNRPARRRLERSGQRTSLRVVKMRRSSHQAAVDYQGGTRGTSGKQWLVRGHWRNQPYGPARAYRRPVWVAAYLKGDPDGEIINTKKLWNADR